MTMRITTQDITWIANQYRQGRSIDELVIDTGLSVKSIKRALAEAGEIYLSWHKTEQENVLLSYLRSKDIYNITDLFQATTL